MTAAERIQVLRTNGLSEEAVAAILNIDPADVVAVSLDPGASVEVPSAETQAIWTPDDEDYVDPWSKLTSGFTQFYRRGDLVFVRFGAQYNDALAGAELFAAALANVPAEFVPSGERRLGAGQVIFSAVDYPFTVGSVGYYGDEDPPGLYGEINPPVDGWPEDNLGCWLYLTGFYSLTGAA